MHQGTCVTHVSWCMPGSLTSGFISCRWRRKRSRHSSRMRNRQFCISGKRPMWISYTDWDSGTDMNEFDGYRLGFRNRHEWIWRDCHRLIVFIVPTCIFSESYANLCFVPTEGINLLMFCVIFCLTITTSYTWCQKFDDSTLGNFKLSSKVLLLKCGRNEERFLTVHGGQGGGRETVATNTAMLVI